MLKRYFQMTITLLAVAFFVLTPIACQQAEPPADTTETAPTGNPDGKKLMAAKPKAEAAVEEAGEVVEEAAEAVEEVVEEGAEAVEGAVEGH